jgi:hypothetical protein
VPQSIPEPVTVPNPVPPFATVNPNEPTGTSSSLIVPTPCASAIVAFTGAERFTRNVSFGSCVVSPTTGTVTGSLVSPGANVTVPLEDV